MRARAGVRGATLALAAGMVTAVVAAVSPTAAGTVGSASDAPAAAEGEADWTFMIYSIGDTDNIADQTVRNLARFADLPDMANVNVVALVDLPERDDPGAPTSRLPGVDDFTTAKLFKLEGGRYQEVRDLGEVSMSRPDVLAGFIEETADRFPAKKYGLVLSDHGGAYTGGYTDTGPPSSDSMTIEEMRLGMLDGMQRAGIDRFELLDHDACLMASYEVASALAPLVKTMVASEEITAGDNTLAPEAIAALGQDVSGVEWGQINNEAYATYIDGAPQGMGAFTAMSTIDGDQMGALDAALESFANVAVANMDQIAPQLGQARSSALEFQVGWPGGGQGSIDAIDLGDFLRHLQGVPPEVEVARDAVFAALDGAVVGQVTRSATQQATGLNVFFPDSPSEIRPYLEANTAPPGWASLIEAYLAATTDPGGDRSATFVSDEATILEQGPGGIRIAGQLTAGSAANVTGTEVQVFADIDGRETLAVLLPGYLNSGGEGMVQGVWDYGVTALTDGATSSPASAFYQAQSGGLVGTFRAHYVNPAGAESDVLFRVLLNSEGRITDYSVADATSGDATAGLQLEEGGSLTPYLLVSTGNGYGWIPAARSIPITPDFNVTYPQLPARTRFSMGVVVADLADNLDGAYARARVPEGRTR